MTYDCITIGDCMRDIFIFPSIEEMEKPVSDRQIHGHGSFEKYLVFGLGDKITISDVEFSVGGTAANVAVGLSKLGLKTSIISAVGGDNAGGEVEDKIALLKVNIENIKVYKKQKTSFSVIVSYKGERTIFVYHAYLPEHFELLDNISTKWLYLGPMGKGYERLFDKIVNFVIKNNLKIALNPSSIQIEAGLNSFGGLLKLIKIIFLNREEAQKLSGLRGILTAKDIAKIIQSQGPEMVVITDGKEGAYVYTHDEFYKVGAYPGHRLDSTGAGDAFASGFLAARVEGEGLQSSLKWGVVNAASVIEKIGAQEGLLTKNIIKRRVKEYKWPADTLRFS